MAIKSIQLNEPGQSGVEPRIIRIETDDTVATVTTAGYLTDAVKKGLLSLSESDMALVVTKESAAGAKEVGWFEVSESSGAWSLVPPASPGDVVLPTVANRLAHFTNTTGTLSGAAADVVNLGDLTLGASGTEGILNLFPATAAKGSLIIKPIANTGDTSVTLSNAAHGQTTVVSIPDGGQATAEFVLTETAGSQQINGTTITYKDNATSFRLKGPSSPNDPSAGADVQTYSGMFYNDSYDTFGVLKTRATYGANAEMDLVLQAPRALLLIAQDGGQSDGVVKAASQTDIQMHARYAAEQVTKWLSVDRVTTGSAGSGNTSDMALNTSDGHLHLQTVSTTHAVVMPTAVEGDIADLVDGIVIYDTTANKLKVYANGGWETVTSS